MSSKLLFKDETYAIRGAVFEVYKEKGCGFLEGVYQECLEIEFEARGIPFVRHPLMSLEYKGRPLKSTFVPDLVCFGAIVIELKALPDLADAHRVQLQNYLRSTTLGVGLLVNFGHYPGVELERYVMQEGRLTRQPARVSNISDVGI
jgi:GxxExxY protein